MRKLPGDLKTKKQPGLQRDTYAWLLEVELSRSPQAVVMLRICDQPEQMTFRGVQWDGVPFAVTGLSHDVDGGISPITITVSNATHEAGRFVAAAGGLGNAPAKLMLVLRSNLDLGHAAIEHAFRIHEPNVSNQAVSIESASPLALSEDWPIYTYARDRCQAKYRDGETCGYLGSPHATCEHHMTACTVRGLAEAAEGWPNLHPQYFYGFPGLPEARR